MIIADTNEFHPLIDGETYKNARELDGSNHPVIIMRATYSTTHVDIAYAASVKRARSAGLLIGHYGYMTATQDAALQGRFFARTVIVNGGLKPGDTVWCDDEEGLGNQAVRAMAFLNAAHDLLKDNRADEGVYSGAAFWTAHLGSLPSGPHRWVAAYGSPDPRIPGEDLWQFTDKRNMAGVQGPCDASIYNGTLARFKSMAGANGSPPAPSPKPVKKFTLEDNMQYLMPGEAAPVGWTDDTKQIRFVSNAGVDHPVPFRVDWFSPNDSANKEAAYGNVVDVNIPDGRGATIHRLDSATDPSGNAKLGFLLNG